MQALDEQKNYFVGELWTSKQRQMFPLHYTVSYRGSFKAELPQFFIKEFLGEIPLILDHLYPLDQRPI
ncbi:MAG: hypothetical protein ACXAEU_25915, partial [Candidatus Hodarchaeales archaeon]